MFTVIIFYIIVIILLASKLCICLCVLGWEKKNKLSIFKETLPGKLEKNASKRGIEAGPAQNTKSTKNIENIKSLKVSKGWN